MTRQLTAAADIFHAAPQEWYELPQRIRDLTEAASCARDTWNLMDDYLSSRRDDHPADYHDARPAEQAAYNTWQAIELAYQQIVGRLVATRAAESEPAPPLPDVYCKGCGWQGAADPSIACPQCGLPDLRRFVADAQAEAKRTLAQLEAERKQRANAASIADGYGPIYASEY